MGTAVSLDIPAATKADIFEVVFARLRSIDARFSSYKKDSELSRFRRAELKPTELSREMKQVMAACKRAEVDTDGYFSAWYEGNFEPSGYVKGWAIAEAGKLLKAHNYQTFCLSIGGDILASSVGDKVWRVGLQDPKNKQALIGSLEIKNGAVATSGLYERGQHIINPKTGQPATELLALTVTGPDIIKADILATAGVAMGPAAINFIAGFKNYQALAVDKTGQIITSPGFRELLNRSPGSSRFLFAAA